MLKKLIANLKNWIENAVKNRDGHLSDVFK